MLLVKGSEDITLTAKRIDSNQKLIVQGLRAIGCTIQDLSQVGRGTPDILCGYKGKNYLFEIKNASDRAPRLTPSEERWIRGWNGQVGVITSVLDAIAIVTQDADYEDATNQSK